MSGNVLQRLGVKKFKFLSEEGRKLSLDEHDLLAVELSRGSEKT